ncbi:MAG: DUF3019 domain-containing protein [Granulosicoccus sp.]
MSSSLWGLLDRSGLFACYQLKYRRLLLARRVSITGVFIFCVGWPLSALTQNDMKLIVKPDSCVALHRGQQCFMRVQLSWNAAAGSELCIHANNDDEPMVCVQAGASEVTVEYASETSILYSLKEKDTTQALAEVTVRTAWVYRTGRRSSSGWRLF